MAQIIVKYCFPEKDEEYITKIVETIQKNDYDNKLANMNSATTTRDLMGGTVGSSSGEVMSARDDDTRDSSATNQASPTANDSSDSDNTN